MWLHNFPFILLTRVVSPYLISSYFSSDPVSLLRWQQPRQCEPPSLHGPRPGCGHQRLGSTGQYLVTSGECQTFHVFMFQARRHLGDDFSQKIKMRSNTFVATVDSRWVPPSSSLTRIFQLGSLSGLWSPVASGTRVSECTVRRQPRSVRSCLGITEWSPVWPGEAGIMLRSLYIPPSQGPSVTTQATATSWAGARTAPCCSGTGTPAARPSWGRERWVKIGFDQKIVEKTYSLQHPAVHCFVCLHWSA